MQRADTYSEFTAFHRLAQWQRLTAFLFILRSWSPTHSLIFYFAYDFMQTTNFVCNQYLKELICKYTKKTQKNKYLNKKTAYISPTLKSDE